jgi:hypothetical protein
VEVDRAQIDREIRSFALAPLVAAAVNSGVVDALGEESHSAEDLAGDLGLDVGRLRRLLRGLAVLGYAQITADGSFALSPKLAVFRSDAPASMREAARWLGSHTYRAFGEITETLQTGKAGFDVAHGGTLWERSAADPELASAFNGAMQSFSQPIADGLAQQLTVGDAHVVDVGGGKGHLLAALLAANPSARGTVFDREVVGEAARAFLEERGLARRCDFVGGDFFEAVPAGAGFYVIKWILHDWSDADCVRILATCRAAMPADGRVVVVERRLPEDAELAAGDPDGLSNVMGDLTMLAMFGGGSGQERTIREYEALFAAAGLEREETLSLPGGFVALVARAGG